jgi:hypothetical protein
VAGPYPRIGTVGNVRANDGSPRDARVLIDSHSQALEDLEAAGPGPGGAVTGTKLVNVQDHGVKADAVQITVNVSGAANAVVTCTASSLGTASVFTPDDVDKHIHLDHDGNTVKAWTKLTITGYTSPTQVTLSGSFGSALNGVNAIFMSDNTSAINACLSNLQEGETLYWPAPAKGKWYFTNGDHTWTRPGTAMLGEPTRSGIITTNTTGCIFKINNSYQDVENLAFTHAAVFTNWGGTVNGTYGTSSALLFALPFHYSWGGGIAQNCSFNGFYIGFNLLLGIGYNIYKCFFAGHSMAGVSLMNYDNPDSASFRVFGCDFYTDPGYNGGALCGIRVHTAGGVWLDSCHFFRGEYGILCSLFGNPSTNLRITNHSFEDYADTLVDFTPNPLIASEKIALQPFGLRYLQGSAIAVTQGGGGDFLHSIVIANNNMNTIFGGPGIILGGAGLLAKGICTGNAGSTSGAPIVLTGNSPQNWTAVANQTGSSSHVTGTTPHGTFRVV